MHENPSGETSDIGRQTTDIDISQHTAATDSTLTLTDLEPVPNPDSGLDEGAFAPSGF